MKYRFFVVAVLSLMPALAAAQVQGRNNPTTFRAADPEAEQVQQQPQPSAMPLDQPGRVANVGNGQIGQRQSRTDAAPSLVATTRIESRIQNRIENRIRNRIDRYYDPQANATSPFAVASDQARKNGPSPPR